jgi:hypothetical protein
MKSYTFSGRPPRGGWPEEEEEPPVLIFAKVR